jgi:hypothetical protein
LGVGQARRAQLFAPRVRGGAPAQQRSAGGHGATCSAGVGRPLVLIWTLPRFGSNLTVQSAERQARCPWQRAAAICPICVHSGPCDCDSLVLFSCCSLARSTFFVKRVPHAGSRAARRQLQTERGAAQTITGRVTGADAGPQSSFLADGALGRQPPGRRAGKNAFAPILFEAHQRRQPRLVRVNGRRPAQPAARAARLCQPFCPRQRSADAALERRLPQGAPCVFV